MKIAGRVALIWVLGLVGILMFWELVLRTGLVSPAALASPWEVAAAFPALFSRSGNLGDIFSTISRSFLAFIFSIPLGVAAGCIVFFSGPMRMPAGFLVDFLRSIPATALVPVFMIIYGTGDTAKIAVGTFSSALVVCVATFTGFMNRNETRVNVAKILGLRGGRKLFLVDIPEAAPQIFLGLRAGISLALILVVVSEMFIGSNLGLGKVIADMRYTDDKGRLYAAIITTGVIGYLYNYALVAFEARIFHWRGVP